MRLHFDAPDGRQILRRLRVLYQRGTRAGGESGSFATFAELAWQQVEAGVRGETSLDAWEARKFATAHGPDAEKYKNDYLAASFADAISIYLLSLYLDVDYYDLRERDYPLLAPASMAERLRKIAEIFPAESRV